MLAYSSRGRYLSQVSASVPLPQPFVQAAFNSFSAALPASSP